MPRLLAHRSPRWSRRATAPALTLVIGAATLLLSAQRPSQPPDFKTLAREALSRIDGSTTLAGLQAPVEVVRDRWGVPHIYAQSLDDLFFAQGFVVAQDRLWQMEMYRRMYRGELSTIMGPSYAAHDRLARLLRYRGPHDDSEWTSYHPAGRRTFDAFARGVNAYIAQAGTRLPVEFTLTGVTPGQWTAEDLVLRTQTAMPLADAIAELRLARDVQRVGADSANRLARPSPYRPLVLPEGLDLSQLDSAAIPALQALRTGDVKPPLLPAYAALEGSGASVNNGVQEDSPGSNNWVIAGRLTKNGKPIVANDPHRAVENPSFRYIVHLDAPGYRAIGATEPVLPGVMIGRTERLAWGLTIVGTDQSDVYVAPMDASGRVQIAGVWEAPRIVREVIAVKNAPNDTATLRLTSRGPVFHVDSARRLAYILRSTAQLPGSAGYLSALRYPALRDCREFLEAQRYYLAPTENMICGDVDGNIAWQASAASPKRPNWHGRLPVPADGRYEWQGLRDDLPREFNPARGWISTANHDIHPDGYDPPLFFKRGPARERQNRLEQVFSMTGPFDAAHSRQLQHDAFNADGARDARLFAGWKAQDAEAERLRAAMAAWNGQHTRESLAAAVYRYLGPLLAGRTRTDGSPDARVLEGLLLSARDSLRARFGADIAQWRWGRFNRSELPHPFVQAYDASAVERHGGAGFVAAVGATYREVFDLVHPDSSWATNLPGQSGQPGSPFYDNLVESFGRAEYFPLAFTRAAVERVAAHRLRLVPGRAR
jgi:penicillin G amidase